MSASTATFTLNSFPNGRDLHNNHLALLGTIAVSAGTYPANGIVLSFAGAAVYTGIAPFDGRVYSPTTGIPYQFDPLNQTLRIFTSRAPAPGVTTAAFTPSANFGTSPVLALSANSTQSAFSIDVTAEVTTGANPTLTYVFPQPYSVAPVVVISRGTDADLTAGYWTVIDASTTATPRSSASRSCFASSAGKIPFPRAESEVVACTEKLPSRSSPPSIMR